MSYLAAFVIPIVLLIPCDTFLFDLTTLKPDNGRITDSHFNALMDIITEERRERRQMGQYISTLEQEVKKLIPLTNTLQNEILNLKSNYQTLLVENSNLKSKLVQFEMVNASHAHGLVDLVLLRNETKHLENVLQLTQNKVNLMTNTEEARKQDFLALYNITRNNRLELTKVENSFEKKLQAYQLKNNFTFLQLKQRDELLHNLSLIQDETLAHVIELKRQFINLSENVAVTACGGHVVGDKIAFSKVKESYGVSDSTLDIIKNKGQFVCEKNGLYLFIFSIMTVSSDSYYQIKKNGNILSHVQVAPYESGSTEKTYHTGTGSVVIHMNPNDIVDTKTFGILKDFDEYSCLSLVKLK